MASNILSHGVDLDAIFKPRGTEPPRANVNYIAGGADIAQRYFPSSYPTIDDRPPANTDLLSGGTDLRNLFRDLAYAGGGGTAPAITSHPAGGTITVGSTLNVVVGASGTAPLAYQWRKNGSNIGGATSSSYSFTTTSTGDGGNYDCVVTNAYGSATSNVATITVVTASGTAPAITSHPVGGSINVGDVLNLAVSASGTAPLSYQWRKNGSDMTGRTSSTLTFTTSTPFDSGNYDCRVTNPYGSVTSNVAVVTVSDVAPNITGGTVTGGPYNFAVGNAAHFTVIATGTSLNYIWYKDGSPTGHTGPSGPAFSCTLADAGTYSVTVSNMAGSDSASAVLTVT